MNILVLYGGTSTERAVSICSALRVIKALSDTAHRVIACDYRDPVPSAPLLRLARESDAVFLALHGGDGEGGVLQAALEQAGIFHYTGSDARGASRALDKANAKHCVGKVGIPVARGEIWQPKAPPPAISLPAIVKPLYGGSSVGLKRIESESDLAACTVCEPLLAEEFLSGREFTVGILGDQALPAVEIIPCGGIYDYEHKYTAGATKELCPAPVSKEKAALLRELAMRAFLALGLRDFARIDFKENAEGTPCFLEANTLPGLTETSLLPLAASRAGIPFPALIEHMAKSAAKRKIKEK
ncbi:MAG: D-alanine--D-alanine ligase [Clostridia bacterium]|nr:D-alanine--D-alanine ligase [Clostridia bacterium]